MPAPIRPSQAQQRYCEILQSRPSVVWKNFADGHGLRVHLFFPPDHNADQDIPSVVFFSGGMWVTSTMQELVPWALHLNSIGIACLIPEYRTHYHYEILGIDILQDAKDMWEWTCKNVAALGLNVSNITLAGVDVGALMALHAGMNVRSRFSWLPFRSSARHQQTQPAAFALFRGVLDTGAPEAEFLNLNNEGIDYRGLNPSVKIRRRLPPIFVAHGLRDPLQDPETSEWFCEQWRRAGNRAELYMNPKVDHTLINFDVNPDTFEQINICWRAFMQENGLWSQPEENEPALMI